jgi:hypothetical protein
VTRNFSGFPAKLPILIQRFKKGGPFYYDRSQVEFFRSNQMSDKPFLEARKEFLMRAAIPANKFGHEWR